jgi:hypothetical protein
MNCLRNDSGWAVDSVWGAPRGSNNFPEICIEPLPLATIEEKRWRRDVLITVSALTAVLFAVLTLLIV